MRLPLFLMAALIASNPAFAENRGIVVGNGDYANAPQLADADGTPASDAMREAGFRTVSGSDLKAEDLRKAVSDLLREDPDPGARIGVLNGHFLHNDNDTWLVAADADKPDAVSVGASGVSLRTIMDLLADAKPGAVLLLGTDDGTLEHGSGLEDGLGTLTPPEGVTVLTGSPKVVTDAAVALMQPGTSVKDVLAAQKDLALVKDGNDGLILVPDNATDMPDRTKPSNNILEPDRDAWAKAAADDTADGYQAYLKAFPTGMYAAAASARLQQLGGGISADQDRDDWANAANTNTIEAYAGYLAKHPDGNFADAATRRLTELRLAAGGTAAPSPAPVTKAPAPARQPPRAQQPAPAPVSAAEREEQRLNLGRDTRVIVQRRLALVGYNTGGADGVWGAQTRRAIRAWQGASGFPVTGYMTSRQLATLRDQAIARQGQNQQLTRDNDRDYWQRTGARGGASNLRAYLDRYPNGAYADRAREQLYGNSAKPGSNRAQDDRAWERARSRNTVAAFQSYLNDWPNGRHADQAIQNIRELRGGGRQPLGNPLQLKPEDIIRELLK